MKQPNWNLKKIIKMVLPPRIAVSVIVPVNFNKKLALSPQQDLLYISLGEFESEMALLVFAIFLQLTAIQDGKAHNKAIKTAISFQQYVLQQNLCHSGLSHLIPLVKSLSG